MSRPAWVGLRSTRLGAAVSHTVLVALPMYCLQYVMGKYEESAESLRMSLETVKAHYPEAGASARMWCHHLETQCSIT